MKYSSILTVWNKEDIVILLSLHNCDIKSEVLDTLWELNSLLFAIHDR